MDPQSAADLHLHAADSFEIQSPLPPNLLYPYPDPVVDWEDPLVANGLQQDPQQFNFGTNQMGLMMDLPASPQLAPTAAFKHEQFNQTTSAQYSNQIFQTQQQPQQQQQQFQSPYQTSSAQPQPPLLNDPFLVTHVPTIPHTNNNGFGLIQHHAPIYPSPQTTNQYHSSNHFHNQPYQPPSQPSSASFEVNQLQVPQQQTRHSSDTSIISTAVTPDVGLSSSSGSSGANGNSSRPRASYACIPCRKLKASCDNQRPCSRCIAKGKECIDRSEEDIKSGLARKKRPQPSAPTPTTTTTGPIGSVKSTPSSTQSQSRSINVPVLPPVHVSIPTGANEVPYQTWSRSFLTLLVQSGVRDSVLKLHAKFDTLPVELPKLLEWHTHVSIMCCHLADQMAPEDFALFLTQGLSEDILNSRLWSSSPFAAWSKISTRPFFVVWQPLLPTSNSITNSPADVAEIQIEFKPSSNVGYLRFLQMQTARIMFERELSNGRIRKPLGTSSNSSVAASKDVPQHPSQMTPSSSVSSAMSDLSSVHDSELSTLAKTMSVLDISASLAAPPPTQLPETDDGIGVLHANWCPMATAPDPAATGSDAKMKRSSGMNSVHGHGDGLSSGLDEMPLSDVLPPVSPSLRCLCSLSTPLPATIRINTAFEKLFGWRRIEIEKQLQAEGTAWFRHLTPVSFLPIEQAYAINHWKSQTSYIGELAIQQARLAQLAAAGQQPSPEELQPIDPPEPWLPQTIRIRRKDGSVDPQIYIKRWHIQTSDGLATPSASHITFSKHNPDEIRSHAASPTNNLIDKQPSL